MQVRLLIYRSGPTWDQKPGDVLTVDEAEGGRLIAAGHAEAVDQQATTEEQAEASEEPEASADSVEADAEPEPEPKPKRSRRRKG